MSATDECQQAILAAWSATKAGTQVYTIGFASEAFAGCSTDSTNLNLSTLAATYGVPDTYSAVPAAPGSRHATRLSTWPPTRSTGSAIRPASAARTARPRSRPIPCQRSSRRLRRIFRWPGWSRPAHRGIPVFYGSIKSSSQEWEELLVWGRDAGRRSKATAKA